MSRICTRLSTRSAPRQVQNGQTVAAKASEPLGNFSPPRHAGDDGQPCGRRASLRSADGAAEESCRCRRRRQCRYRRRHSRRCPLLFSTSPIHDPRNRKEGRKEGGGCRVCQINTSKLRPEHTRTHTHTRTKTPSREGGIKMRQWQQPDERFNPSYL